jgi:hypothetical protein
MKWRERRAAGGSATAAVQFLARNPRGCVCVCVCVCVPWLRRGRRRRRRGQLHPAVPLLVWGWDGTDVWYSQKMKIPITIKNS